MQQLRYGFAISIWCHIFLKDCAKKKDSFLFRPGMAHWVLRKIENNSQLIRKAQNWLKMAELSSSYTDFWISNSNFETEVYKSAFWHVHDNS